MTSRTKTILVCIWLVICCAILSLPLLNEHNNELYVLYSLLILGITFPSGYLFALLVAFVSFSLDKCCGFVMPSKDLMLIPTWLGFVVVGYFQWFILLPWTLRTVKKKLKVK